MENNIAPTKSNLMNSKSVLDFSKKGFELLDQKRNVLIREIMSLVDRANEIQSKINTTFLEAYEALQMANITMGIQAVEDIASTVPEVEEFEILFKSIMGVEVPIIKFKSEDEKPSYSFYQTNSSMDVAFTKFQEVKRLIFELAEIENSVYRLANEIKKTQRRANALENIQIPKYEALVKFIQDALEEKDREDFFRLKVVKKKRIKKKNARFLKVDFKNK